MIKRLWCQGKYLLWYLILGEVLASFLTNTKSKSTWVNAQPDKSSLGFRVQGSLVQGLGIRICIELHTGASGRSSQFYLIVNCYGSKCKGWFKFRIGCVWRVVKQRGYGSATYSGNIQLVWYKFMFRRPFNPERWTLNPEPLLLFIKFLF